METISLPIIPNTPHPIDQETLEGDFQLKSFGDFQFIQNVLFDDDLIVYDKNYQNNQGYSDSFKKHMNDVYQIIKNKFPKGSNLVEIGCGKGDFLNIIKEDKWFNYKGYDTAYDGNDKNIEARYLCDQDRIQADIVVLRHTLEHIKAPHKFLMMLREIFSDNASIFIEVPQFNWIHKNKILYDFTYEHVNYFSTISLCALFRKVIKFGDFFGGQYQYCLANLSELNHSQWDKFDQDNNWNAFNFDKYLSEFKKNIIPLETKNRIWIWGGATKGVLFLKHLLDISPLNFKKIIAVVDINPKKQSLFTPSTYMPIISPNEMYSQLQKNDFVLVMNPNYIEEIQKTLSQNTDLRTEVGCF